MSRQPRLPISIRHELDGRQWGWRNGRKHWHLIVDGKMVAIWPKGGGAEKDGFHFLNARAHLRRALRNDSR